MAVAELWEVAKKAIEAYTGLSPAIFFTVLAIGLALYQAVSGFLAPPPPPPRTPRQREEEPLQPPVQLGEITEEELGVYDGSDPSKPLLMAIKGQIYDVTQSRMFYGPGGPYALFAGRDASRALAKMSFEPSDLTSDISGLGTFELEALQDWEYKFMNKYVKVGTIKKTVSVTEPDSNNSEITQESKLEDGPAETSAETKENKLCNDHEAEQLANNESGSSAVGVEADHKAQTKELGCVEDTKE